MADLASLRPLAIYLPQFHPTPENDEWWGPGFTEWTNVVRGRPLFRGHYQPHIPADLGFCDLRVPETRLAQAELAREHGIFGFCYYHYWFNGRRLLDRPFREVLASGEPDFPFCLCWANEDWTRAWDGHTGVRLMVQHYSEDDDRAHVRSLLPAFADPRYVRIDDRPVFLVYRASRLPDPRRTTHVWREEASRAGIGDLYLVRVESEPYDRAEPADFGFDAHMDFQPDWVNLGRPRQRQLPVRALRRALRSRSTYRYHRIFDYEPVVDAMLARPDVEYLRFPCVTPGWDNTPRRPTKLGIVLDGAMPEVYGRWLATVVERFTPPSPDENLVFLNAWNEWAEGNHLEPCRRFGRDYLEATRRVVESHRRDA